MTKDEKPNPSPEFDAAASITQPIALMTAGAMVGVALATQAFGLWMQCTATLLGAIQRRDHTSDSDVRERTSAPSAASHRRSSSAPRPEAQAGELVAPRKNVVPMGSAIASAKRAKAEPVQQDDLKAIAGIGPKLEQVLNGVGVRSYAQIAALGADEVKSLESRFGLEGRIARDDWQKQASLLAARS